MQDFFHQQYVNKSHTLQNGICNVWITGHWMLFVWSRACYARCLTDSYPSKHPRHALSNFESTYFNLSSIAFLTMYRPEDALSKEHAGFMSLRPLYSLGQIQRLTHKTLVRFPWRIGHHFHADLTSPASKGLLQKVHNSRSLSLFIKFKASF